METDLGAGKKAPWGGQASPRQFGILRAGFPQGPPRGPVRKPGPRQDNAVLCGWGRARPPSTLTPFPPAQGPPPGGSPWDQPHPGALGPTVDLNPQLWTKGHKSLFLRGKESPWELYRTHRFLCPPNLLNQNSRAWKGLGNSHCAVSKLPLPFPHTPVGEQGGAGLQGTPGSTALLSTPELSTPGQPCLPQAVVGPL